MTYMAESTQSTGVLFTYSVSISEDNCQAMCQVEPACVAVTHTASSCQLFSTIDTALPALGSKYYVKSCPSRRFINVLVINMFSITVIYLCTPIVYTLSHFNPPLSRHPSDILRFDWPGEPGDTYRDIFNRASPCTWMGRCPDLPSRYTIFPSGYASDASSSGKPSFYFFNRSRLLFLIVPRAMKIYKDSIKLGFFSSSGWVSLVLPKWLIGPCFTWPWQILVLNVLMPRSNLDGINFFF